MGHVPPPLSHTLRRHARETCASSAVKPIENVDSRFHCEFLWFTSERDGVETRVFTVTPDACVFCSFSPHVMQVLSEISGCSRDLSHDSEIVM